MAESATPAPEEYTPRSILVTGGAGFIGSHVVIRLVQRYPGVKIVNFDKLDYCSCLENLQEVADAPNYKFVKGNVCSSDLVTYVLQTEEIDTIMHFAAQTHVDNSFGNSFQFTTSNILGTHVLLEAAKQYGGIRRFIHVSTDEVYGEGNEDQRPMFEHEVLEPTNPYAATKAGAEFIAKSYMRSFGLPVIITRGNNVYGHHQYPEKLIPKFINQIRLGRKCTLHGTGQNTRNFLHASDVASAFDTILHRGAVGSVYNIGGTHEMSNLSVTKLLLRLMGKISAEDEAQETAVEDTPEGQRLILGPLAPFVEQVPDRAFNDLRYTIDSSKLHELGWREEVTWEEGVQQTIDWYMQHTERYGDIEGALVAHPRAGLNAGGDPLAS